MDFVGVDAEGNEEAELPAEETEGPRDEEHRGADEGEVPGTLPPGHVGEEARVVVVDDIGPDEERPDDRGVFREIGVFGPVDDAGDEVGEGGDEDDLERGAEDGEEQVHGDGYFFVF